MNDTVIKERPKRTDASVVAIAAHRLAPQVREWLDQVETVDAIAPLADIEEDLKKAMRWSDTDGYEIAKHLDQQGWVPDSALVEILDSASTYLYDAHKRAQADWVKVTGQQPPALETRVTCIKTTTQMKGVGIVIENHAEGTSLVMFPDMGHVRHVKGAAISGGGSLGYHIEWEKLVPVQ